MGKSENRDYFFLKSLFLLFIAAQAKEKNPLRSKRSTSSKIDKVPVVAFSNLITLAHLPHGCFASLLKPEGLLPLCETMSTCTQMFF